MPKDSSKSHSKKSNAEATSKGGKKAKDPKAPKKPKSAFFLYLDEVRPKIKEEHPDYSVTEVTKEAGEQWRGLDDDQKKPYQEQADKLKEQYNEAKEAYEKENAN